MNSLPKTPTFRLDNKRALVTGASSGIGLACAAALAQAGASVTMAARDLSVLKAAASSVASCGAVVDVLPMDITDVEQTAQQVLEHGPFDILVNSAGLARHKTMLETSMEDFDAVMAVNLRGAYFLTQAVAKGLIENSKEGSLINISSQMGQVGGVERSVYCASKHGIEGFTKSMAIELGLNGIRVNTVSPTFIRTALTKSTFEKPEHRRWIEGKIKLGRIGEVEDVMGAVVYLACDASALVTGTTMMIDGGWTAD